MIELQDITVSLPSGKPDAKTILNSITLTIPDGDWVALVGPNGSGKTTLLGTIAGLVPAQSGTVRIAAGKSRRGIPPSLRDSTTGGDAEKSHVPPPMALLLQEPDNQFVASSVFNELRLSVPRSRNENERRAMLDEALKRFSLLRFVDRNPHRLSGGEKQRLALATVWLPEPEVLLLDEPTSYLDEPGRNQCIQFVKALNGQGVTVVWATPGGEDMREARRVVFIDEGSVRFAGTVNDFLRVAGKEGFAYVPARAGNRGARVRPRAEPQARALSAAHDAAVVSMQSASFAYEKETVLSGITLEVHAGEMIGVTGHNGSGKSTLLALMSGILNPTSGRIIHAYSRPVEGERQNVFHLFQNPERMFFAETVHEELSFGLKRLGVPREEKKKRVSEALARVGLDSAAYEARSPFQLSFGEMRRVAFAMALALRPKFLLLDEPASCLDNAGRTVLRELIRTLKSEGTALVAASTDFDEDALPADRVIALQGGRVVSPTPRKL